MVEVDAHPEGRGFHVGPNALAHPVVEVQERFDRGEVAVAQDALLEQGGERLHAIALRDEGVDGHLHKRDPKDDRDAYFHNAQHVNEQVGERVHHGLRALVLDAVAKRIIHTVVTGDGGRLNELVWSHNELWRGGELPLQALPFPACYLAQD